MMCTIMCAATCFPETIPQCSLMAKAVVKPLDYQDVSRQIRDITLCPKFLVIGYVRALSQT